MTDIKVGQLWGVDWPDRDEINPAVRGKSVGYRVTEVWPGQGFAVRETKSWTYGRYRGTKNMPSHWKLIEDVP